MGNEECICGYTGEDFIVLRINDRVVKTLAEIDLNDVFDTPDNVALFDFKRFMKDNYNSDSRDKVAILEFLNG